MFAERATAGGGQSDRRRGLAERRSAGSPSPRRFRGEPAVSRSGGPCGPPECALRARAEAGGGAAARTPTRRQRAAAGLAAVEVGAVADGRSGVPAGLDRADPTRGSGAQRTSRVTGRRGYSRSAASCGPRHRTGRPRRGCTPPDWSDNGAKGGSRASAGSEESATESGHETCRWVVG